MSKKGVSIILSVIFILFIVAPTILTIVDDTIDVSIVFSVSEEENESCTVDAPVLFLNHKTCEFYFDVASNENNSGYVFKNYPIPHFNLISPPPDFIS
ncbi:hypothetical protein KO494_15585 [Lacinutrix sp. C3R15]|uniref:hypothetical protein n=1 Tax=Flavobacteriaceae TaxID=49546 RepID=UPI001C088280|nr:MULTISPECIES: hypothetical protein [Flavobacteriaceae]MBU2940972.1 hypothetical protein [Lacinutrix sp. C3R15]MDO6624291.1 hypothetical protein [Oceanihabitans sp. 1_MG-2023]